MNGVSNDSMLFQFKLRVCMSCKSTVGVGYGLCLNASVCTLVREEDRPSSDWLCSAAQQYLKYRQGSISSLLSLLLAVLHVKHTNIVMIDTVVVYLLHQEQFAFIYIYM